MSPTLQNRPSGTMTGGRALAEMLRLAGAGPMFGMGGFQLLPFYDAVGLVGLNHHLINDERCGAFAADAYARVTNRPGICDGTLGPGATNLVTGLVESLNGGIPIVAITGDTNRMHSWKNMTQECRQVEILRPAVKELIRVEMTARIPELVRRAFAVATSGRPGPVLLDVPEDVAHGTHDFAPEDFVIDEATLKAPARRIRPDRADIERAAKLIAKAKRPLLLTGGGIHLSEAWSALTRFAEAQSIPVAHTMSGKGGIACTNPLSVGLFGRYSRIANDLIEASDCLIVVGCKLGEIATKRFALPPTRIPVIHLDIVAEEIGRCIPVEIALWGDARAGLEDLTDALSDSGAAARAARADYAAEIAPRMKAWEDDAAPRLNSRDRPVHMARLCRELNTTLPEDAMLVADGGFAGHWTGLLYDTKKPGRTLHPGSRLRLHRLRAAGWHGRCTRRARSTRRRDQRRWRLQHDARRTGDRAPHWMRSHGDRRQQRRLRLRQGVAARDDGRALPVGRPQRDGLRGDRPHDGLRRHSRRRPRGVVSGTSAGHGRTRPPNRYRRRRHPRSRANAARGRQPHGGDQARRSGGLTPDHNPQRIASVSRSRRRSW